ncbi:MAG: exodeoxyribonuclease VII small subunit [Deltaproteobacteria bacterium]|nr:exodeoxyribonuclease VII small subunit [Deltaproteobacteria bacterium]
MARQTFESAIKRLEAIVEDLESGNLALDDALKKFQEGVKISRFCSKKLDETEKKGAILLKDDEGEVRSEPFSIKSDEDEEI